MMKQIITAKNLIVGLSVLDELDSAMETTAKRVKDVADILEEIDNNLEVETDDENLHL